MSIEYDRTKSVAGFFDATQTFGRLLARGKDALDLLHRMSTGDIRPLFDKPGLGVQTVLTNEKGRIVDLLTVLSREKDALIALSKDHEEKVIQWLDKFTIMEDAKFVNVTNSVHQFGVFGPRALLCFQQHTSENLIALPPLSSINITVGGFLALLQKAQRIAESGWWVFVDDPFAVDVKQLLEAEVLALGGSLIDEPTFDILRIESGMPIAPNELNERHNPLETTLVSAVSFTKGCYIGQEVIARLDSYDKVQRHMMGITIEGHLPDLVAEFGENHKRPLRVEIAGGEQIGELTSVAASPAISKLIGLGFVKTAYANPGQTVGVRLDDVRLLPARLEKLPFELD